MCKKLMTERSDFFVTDLTVFYSLSRKVLNLNVEVSSNSEHAKYWKKVDISDKDVLIAEKEEFQLDYKYYMVARIDQERVMFSYYCPDIECVRSLISTVKHLENVQELIFEGSRLVCDIEYSPKDVNDDTLSTFYGQVQGLVNYGKA